MIRHRTMDRFSNRNIYSFLVPHGCEYECRELLLKIVKLHLSSVWGMHVHVHVCTGEMLHWLFFQVNPWQTVTPGLWVTLLRDNAGHWCWCWSPPVYLPLWWAHPWDPFFQWRLAHPVQPTGKDVLPEGRTHSFLELLGLSAYLLICSSVFSFAREHWERPPRDSHHFSLCLQSQGGIVKWVLL